MTKIIKYIQKTPLMVLLLAIPLVILAEIAHWGELFVFIASALGIIPLAGLLGTATEALATRTNPKVGGLLNATLGNAAELIITIAAIRAGLLELVKASITGSIIGNLLFVLGFSMLLGSFKHGLQTFDRRQASNYTVLLTIAILALVIPSIFSASIGAVGSIKVEALSLGVSIVMIILYSLGLYYSMKSTQSPLAYLPPPTHEEKVMSLPKSLTILAISTLAVVWLSELLVGSVEPVVKSSGISEFFLGIILIPIIGNAAEHIVAVQVAIRNKMELSVEIAVSSSMQIALFVAPLLVFVSLIVGTPMTLIFNPFELIALGSAVLITTLVAADGESNWLEGAAMLGVYLILSLAFYLMPG
jgi:Ca2+:H+ antiporter